MFRGKKNETKSKSATGTAPPAQAVFGSPLGISLDFMEGAEIEAAHGGCQSGVITNGMCMLGQGQGIRSVASLDARPGDGFVLETVVSADLDPTNGEPLVCFTGLLFYNAEHRVVQWWTAKPAISRADGMRTLHDSVVAPDGAVSVRIGISGPWRQSGTVSNGQIAVVRAAARAI
jgi:hypothetical protein